MPIKETVYIGRDNSIAIQLVADGTAITHTDITRVVIKGFPTTLDSDTSASLFDWSDSTKLVLSLGAANIAAGSYKITPIIYLPTYTSGIVWGYESITAKVYSGI